MTMSINVGDINMDGLSGHAPWLPVVLLLGTLLLRHHFKLVVALLVALLPKSYCQRFLEVFSQLEDPTTTVREGDPSGTPRRKKSRKRT